MPLVSFEGICGEQIPPVTGRSRIVVFHCLGSELEGGYFAIGTWVVAEVIALIVMQMTIFGGGIGMNGHRPEPQQVVGQLVGLA